MRCLADKGRKRGKTRGGKRRKKVVKGVLSRAELVGWASTLLVFLGLFPTRFLLLPSAIR